jgi:hypothetical protein
MSVCPPHTFSDRALHFRTAILEVDALMIGANDSEKESDELADFARGIESVLSTLQTLKK